MTDQPPRLRVVAALQVRVNSTRLPRKALLPIAGRAMFLRCWDRLALCRELDSIVVATSQDPANDVVEALCTRESVGCVRGGQTDEDVIGRLVEAAQATRADAIVRVTSDCPLIDSGIVDEVVRRWRAMPRFDYVSNVRPRTFPDGLDAELVTAECLGWLGSTRLKAGDRIDGRLVDNDRYTEEPTRYIWDFSDGFRIAPGIVNQRATYGHPSGPVEDLSALRWTVDYEADLEFARWAWERLPEGFGWRDVLALGARAVPAEMAERFALTGGEGNM